MSRPLCLVFSSSDSPGNGSRLVVPVKVNVQAPSRDGDLVLVRSILEDVSNAVVIAGAVRQPGRYELRSDVRTVRDLIERADGLRKEAYLEKADLVRQVITLGSPFRITPTAEPSGSST